MLWILKLQRSSVFTCVRIPWTRARQWLHFLILFLVIVLMFTAYKFKTTIKCFIILETSLLPSPSNNIMTSSFDDLSDSASQFFVAYPHHYSFILDEPNRCRQESPFLVLMIPVAPHEREARDRIRNTWGNQTTVLGQVVSHYFLLGLSREDDGKEKLQEQVLQESQIHQDIIQSNFLDSYNNLTIKTMVMFEWLSSHCPTTSYAMKVDSDIFLNVHKLTDMLLTAPRHLYMTGLVIRCGVVVQDESSKWYLPGSAFPEGYYPPYVMGLGYVFSMDLPQKIVEASLHVKAVYIEDVYVGLCMSYLGIELTDPPHAGLFRAMIPYFTYNCYWTSVIAVILQDSQQLSDVWRVYQTQVQSGC
uniref:Hexosyltransferase n=1 Tax=Monopterus albus TaxID=43700 RepID=A0A3Q3QRK7_MONAL